MQRIKVKVINMCIIYLNPQEYTKYKSRKYDNGDHEDLIWNTNIHPSDERMKQNLVDES